MPTYVDITLAAGSEYNTQQIAYSLSHDEGGYAWTADITLGQIQDYQRLSIGDPVVLTIGATEYSLIVDSKSINRGGPADVQLRLSAISPIALLTQPWVLPYTKTWDAPILASEVAQEIAALAGLTITWGMIDWVVAPDTLVIEEGQPLDALLSLSTAAGGTIESLPNGDIVVRNLYPVSPKDYGTAAPSHILEDRPDKLSVESPISVGEYFNYIEIGDKEFSAEGEDTIEFIQDENDPLRGILRVYPNPWRTDWWLESTGDTTIILTKVGGKILEESEEIAFSEFEGSVQYPVYQVNSVDWRIRDLGSLTHDVDDTKLTAGGPDAYGYSYATVTYIKRFVEYNVSGEIGDLAHIIMVENVNDA